MADDRPERPEVLIEILRFQDWRPLSRTMRLDELLAHLGEARSERLYEEFARWLMAVYKARVQRAIRTQQFPVRYAPLTPRWLATKRRRGWNQGFWIASGHLVKSIRVWRYGGVWKIGWPRGHPWHPVHGRPFAAMARGLERGVPEIGLPARPLFTPIARQHSRNIVQLFRRFLRQRHGSLLKYVR